MHIARRSLITLLGAASVATDVTAQEGNSGSTGRAASPATAPSASGVDRAVIADRAIYPELRGRVALVTGGSGLIGAETCRVLADNGMRVVVNGRDSARIDSVVESIRSRGGEALNGQADCTRADDLERLRTNIEKHWGPIDALLAFAGGGTDGKQSRPKPIMEVSESEWRRALDDNLTLTFTTLRAFLPKLVERNQGSVVTMSSAGGRLAAGAPNAYSVAKAGVIMLTRMVAEEVAPARVRVNCLAPSAIRAPDDPQASQLAGFFPLHRVGEPRDVALAALYLISGSAAWVTGITLDVAGGRVML